MLSTLLNDGSIVLNLGHMRVVGLEIHPCHCLPTSTPLYHDRCSFREINLQELTRLIVEAADLIRSCFETTNGQRPLFMQ